MTVDVPTTPVAQEPQAPVIPAIVPVPAQPETPPAPKAEEKTFTQAELNAILKDRLDRERNAATEKANAEKKAAEEEQAKQQGEWQKLAEQRAADLEAMKAEIKRRDHDALRSKVAAANKLPAEWASRLLGDDEAALDADAKSLAKTLVPATPAPGAGPSPKPSGPVGAMTDDEARNRHSRGLYSW